jgi:Protein of unknown function (DUF3606)
MAAAKKTARARKQDWGRVAGGQDYLRDESKKTGRSAAAVKKAVKKVGNSRKRGREAARRPKQRLRRNPGSVRPFPHFARSTASSERSRKALRAAATTSPPFASG